MAEANSWLQLNQAAKSCALVDQEHLADLSEQQADLLLGARYEAQGNAAEATARYQKIYVDHPLSAEASEAEAALAAPNPSAGGSAGARVQADRWRRLHSRSQATEGAASAIERRGSGLARVRMGAAQYLAGEYQPAYQHLTSFQASTAGEPEAERLYYLVAMRPKDGPH